MGPDPVIENTKEGLGQLLQVTNDLCSSVRERSEKGLPDRDNAAGPTPSVVRDQVMAFLSETKPSKPAAVDIPAANGKEK